MTRNTPTMVQTTVPQNAAPSNTGAANISMWRQVAFSSPAFPLASMLVPILLYLPDFYARELGMNLTLLAGVMTFVRLFDLWFDPAAGIAIDKTNTRFGRFRPWFVVGVPVGMVSMYMLYNAPVGVTAGYLLIWLVAVNIGQSMSHLAHMSWAASIWSDYDDRSRAYGWFVIFSTVGIFTIMAMPPVMVLLFGASHTDGVISMGWLIIVALPLTMVLALGAVRERHTPRVKDKPRLKDYLKLAKRPSVIRLVIVDAMWSIGPSVAGTLFFAFYDGLKHLPREISGLALLMYFVGGLVFSPLWMALSKRWGKHNALVVASLTYAALQSMLLLLPINQPWLVGLALFIAGAPSNAGPILITSMTADAADDVRLESGLDRTALMFGLRNGLSKIGTTVSVGLALYVLGVVGYDFKLGTGNDETSLTVLACLYALVPAVVGITAALVIKGHKLDATAHAEIRRALDERDRLAPAAVV
ncbi:MAG TPA: MFS transporter [Rhizomicrobium sp.]|nr:MFS transporter [Rhizomicrobium sp.]